MLRRKTRQLSSVGGALESAIARLGLSHKLAQQRALVLWPQVVGPQIAAATTPLQVRDGILFVAAKSSVWAHELIYRKAGILAALHRELGPDSLTDIRFVTRGYQSPKADIPGAPECGPGPAEWEQIDLSEQDRAALTDRLQSVTDPDLRARLERLMVHDLRVRRWKEAHGWPRCTECGLPHPGPSERCWACQPRWVRPR